MADTELSLIGGYSKPLTQKCKDCGEIKPVSEFPWHKGKKRRSKARCGECYNALARDRAKQDYERARNDLVLWMFRNLRRVRKTCRDKGLECNITAMDIKNIYDAQDGKCALTDRSMVFGSKGQQRDSLSIDRIEPVKGYVLGNVRLVTYQANFARGMFSDDELYAFCEAVLATRAAALAEAAE